MPSREYVLDDGRKIKYDLRDWTNYETDTEYYVLEVRVYEKRRSLLTVGLTKKWKRTDFEHKKIEDPEDIRDEFRKMRGIVLGEEQSPLEKLLDDALVEIEPNHRGE